MSRAIEVVIYREEDQWVAQALNVDVSSFGTTPEEARSAIKEALELYFEDQPDAEIPEVTDTRVEHLSVQALFEQRSAGRAPACRISGDKPTRQPHQATRDP
jgi:predicted RNase H-like HicB family nuclease